MHPVQNISEIEARLLERADEIRGLGVDRLAVFGSFAHGRHGSSSDVDVLVGFKAGEKTYERFLDLADLIEEVLGRTVDLVTTEALSPHLGPRILAEARDVLAAA